MIELTPRELGLITSQPVCRLGTTNADGSVHMVALCPVVVDGSVYVDLQGARKSEANIRRDPRATVLFDEYSSHWEKLWGLQLRCDAEFLAQGTDEWSSIWSRFQAQYPQQEPFGWQPRQLTRLVPVQKASWGT